MAIVEIHYDTNPAQEEFHSDLKSKILMLCGGLGCLREDALVQTSCGLVPISQVTKSDYVLSFDGKHNQFVFSRGGGAFPKGKESLYRVISEHGEFVSSARHLVFSSDSTWKQVLDLSSGDYLTSYSGNLEGKNPFFGERLLLSGVLDCFEIFLSLIERCELCIHQYDPRLLLDLKACLSDLPLLSYAQEYGHIICPEYISRGGDSRDMGLIHNRHSLCSFPRPMRDLIHHMEGLALGGGDPIFSKSPGHILRGKALELLSLRFSEIHPKVLLSFLYRIYNYLSFSSSPYSSVGNKSKILSVEKLGKPDWVWDMSIPNTNCYFANGFLHHNSGKTHALIMKILQLSWINRGFAGGVLAPSYPEYKRDVLPLITNILEDHGLWKFTKYNITDKTFYFPWSKAPLYVFTADKPIAGPNLAYCAINEFSLMPEDRVNEMLRRVRVKDAPVLQRCLVGTPEDTYGWLEEFVSTQTSTGRLRIIQGKTTDNPYIDQDYINHLRETLDPQAFKLFAEGMIITLKGNQFYYAFSMENVVTTERMEGKTVYANVDFNVGRMSATFANIYFEGPQKKILIFDEVVLTDHSSDTYAIAEAIKVRFGTANVVLTCDASGAHRRSGGSSDVKILQAFGFEVRYRSANPRLRKRQLLVNGLLSHKHILVNKNCKETITDFRKVLQDVKDFSKVKTDGARTHLSDTIDYLVDFEFKIDDTKDYVRRKIF